VLQVAQNMATQADKAHDVTELKTLLQLPFHKIEHLIRLAGSDAAKMITVETMGEKLLLAYIDAFNVLKNKNDF